MSMITVKNLEKKFGRKNVLNSLNLEVEEREFLVMFGPNGAGKTTLVKILATLSKPTSGEVVINGHDIKEEPIHVRKCIGVLSHNSFLYEDLTLKENLVFYSKMYGLGKDEKAIRDLADEVGLLHRLNDRVGQFSRGMKQRAAIARAVLHEPKVLLLDEPYTGLDSKARDMLTGMLRKFHEQGTTIFLITHDVELGYALGNRLAILARGAIAADKGKKDIEYIAFKEECHNVMEGQT